MYFPDLSPYTYLLDSEIDEDAGALNVGWLSTAHEYPRGAAPEGLLERLWWLCLASVRRTRGFHCCEMCGGYLAADETGWPRSGIAERDGAVQYLGSAEIRVEGTDGTAFAAPNLIYHYVAVHRYLPPRAFVAAAMALTEAADPEKWKARWRDS